MISTYFHSVTFPILSKTILFIRSPISGVILTLLPLLSCQAFCKFCKVLCVIGFGHDLYKDCSVQPLSYQVHDLQVLEVNILELSTLCDILLSCFRVEYYGPPLIIAHSSLCIFSSVLKSQDRCSKYVSVSQLPIFLGDCLWLQQ